jgi:hypothetical protein
MLKRSLLIQSVLFAAFAVLGSMMPANATMPPSSGLGYGLTVKADTMTPWLLTSLVVTTPTAVAPSPFPAGLTRVRDTHADRSRTAWANRKVLQISFTHFRTLKPDIPKRSIK